METKQLLTVVIPVLNRQSLLERTLDSVAAQSTDAMKLIIVDNGSDDDTLAVAQNWASIHESDFSISIISEPRRGASIARNRGLREVDTPFVMFFDSDDVMRDNHIKRIVEELQRTPDIDILRWDVAIIDQDGWSSTQSKHFHDELQLHLMHSTLSTQRYVCRTELLRHIGAWDEQLSTWDDLELGVRLLLSTEKVGKLHGDPTVAIYHTPDSISGVTFSDRDIERESALDHIETILKQHGRTEDLFMLDCRRKILAACYQREGNTERARQLCRKQTQNLSARQRLTLSAVYLATRLFGRGGSALSLALAGKKRQRC